MAGLQTVIRSAQQAGSSVRAYGGTWSLSSAAYSPDVMINTKPLNARQIGLSAASVAPTSPVAAGHLFFVQCGNQVQEVHDALEASQLALKTSGASDGQTMAGAISTGTHGAANAIGAMQDSVVGIHLLVEDGTPLWLERDSTPPIVTEHMLSLLDTPPGALRRHDDLFNAALVSFGSFGVVHAYLVEVEDLYSLEAYSRRMDFDAVLAAMTTLDVSSLGLPEGSVLPFHFEIGLNLYRMGKGQKGAFVRFMYKRPGGTPAPPAPLPGGHRPGDDLLGIIGTLSDVVPALIPDLVTTLMDSNLPTYEAVRATPGYTFGPTTIRGKGLSTEMGFKLSDVGAAVDVMANVARVFPFGGVVGIRYVAASKALAAFTQYGPTCTIEIQAVQTDRSREAYRRIWAGLDAAGIGFTLHWGQALPYEPTRYQRAYGARLDRWKAARASILSPSGRRLFSNDLVRGVGLE